MTQISTSSFAASPATPPPAAWYPDPSGKYTHRYWDGQDWTEHVATEGRQDVDPVGRASTGKEEVKEEAEEAKEEGATPAATTSVPAATTSQPAATSVSTPELFDELDIPRFGARAKARELAVEVNALRVERDQLHAERQRFAKLGVVDVAELEVRRTALTGEVAELDQELARGRATVSAELEQRRSTAARELETELASTTKKRDDLTFRLAELQEKVVDTEELAILQEVGVYEYRHPLTDAVAYQAELKRIQDGIKAMARKDGGAVLANDDWNVNGSRTQGRTMIRDYSKLILRAYNAEADNLVRGMKPYKLETSIERLLKVATTIEKLGKTMDIRVAPAYQDQRVTELELTADYLEKKAEEKEREREEKARLREERKAQQEMERERARLEKERQHHANALHALVARGDEEAAARLREQLADVDRKIEDVDYRAANIRAGYVYVISNLGSFGENVVKVGLTRRLDPQDRVRELGDASVPFKFDVHAILFSQDAVELETKLHQRLADRRMNLVNRRREFFRATPQEVKALLIELEAEVLEYDELAAAVEYRQSVTTVPSGAKGARLY